MALPPDDMKAFQEAWRTLRPMAEQHHHGRQPDHGQMARAAHHAQTLARIAEEHAQDLDAMYQNFIAQAAVPEDSKAALDRTVRAAGGFAAWLRDQAVNVGRTGQPS